jgi:hypothetical protein
MFRKATSKNELAGAGAVLSLNQENLMDVLVPKTMVLKCSLIGPGCVMGAALLLAGNLRDQWQPAPGPLQTCWANGSRPPIAPSPEATGQ